MEGQQLSSTRVGTARGEQSTLLTSTAEQQGRMAADWAASQRRRQRGEPEQETEPEATSITLKQRAEELREQLEWTKPQRPLLDGGQGKHISGASKSQKRRRRKRLLHVAAKEDGKQPLAGVTSVPSGDELSPVPLRAEGIGPNQPATQRPQVPVTNGRPNQPAAQRVSRQQNNGLKCQGLMCHQSMGGLTNSQPNGPTSHQISGLTCHGLMCQITS